MPPVHSRTPRPGATRSTDRQRFADLADAHVNQALPHIRTGTPAALLDAARHLRTASSYTADAYRIGRIDEADIVDAKIADAYDALADAQRNPANRELLLNLLDPERHPVDPPALCHIDGYPETDLGDLAVTLLTPPNYRIEHPDQHLLAGPATALVRLTEDGHFHARSVTLLTFPDLELVNATAALFKPTDPGTPLGTLTGARTTAIALTA